VVLKVSERNISERNKGESTLHDTRASTCDKILADRRRLLSQQFDPAAI
jgi:hypothetical protein